MQNVDPRLARTISWIAGTVAIVVAIALPFGYFSVSYQYELGMLDAQAEINGRIASQVINTNPEMWRFMNHRLEGLLSRRPRSGFAEVRRIVDNDNKIIAQSVDALDSPTIMRSAELLDSGIVVGRIEIIRSLRPLLIRSGGAALFGLLLGWTVFVSLKIFPLRALVRALADNARLLREAERRANEYARLFEETAQLAQEQTALSAIANAASQSLHVDEMLQNALTKTLEVTKRTIGIVRLKDDVTGRLRMVGHKGISEAHANILDKEQTIGRKALEVLSTGEIHVMNNPSPAELMMGSRREGIQSRVWVPIQGHGQILGVLTVASSVVQPFETREVELLKAVGSIFGTAVANARLLEETEQRAKEQEALNVIAKASNQSLHRDELLDLVLNKLLEVMGRERVSIRLKNPVTGAVQLVAHRGFSQNEVDDLLRRVPHKASDQVFASGQPLIVNNPGEIRDSQSLLPHSYAVAWIPVKAGARILGVLGVAAGRPVPFMQREVDVLQVVGNMIGVALENAGLFEESQRNLRRIQALRDIDQAINSTLNLRQVLDILLEKIEVFLPYASATTVRLFNKQSGKIEPITCRNLDEEEWKAEPWKVGRGSPNIVFESGRPVRVWDIQSDPRTKDPEFFRRYGLISYLGVPLVVQGEVLGVLSLYSKEKREFSEQEMDFLSTLAGQASIAIHNSQLYEQTERRRREAEELARLAQSLTDTLDMTAVGERIVASVHELFNPRHSTLRLLEPDGSLRAVASSGEVFSQSSRGEAVPPGVGVTSRAIAEGRPIWSADMLNDPEIRLTDRMREYQLRSGNRSMIAVPLRAHERIIGALVLSDKVGRSYSDNEVALVQTFADQAALALEKARLYEEVRQKVEELQRKTSELEKANKTKDEFLSTMSHELRTPLNVVIGYSALLKEGMLGKISAEQDEALGKILGRAHDQLQMINTILEATQIGAGAVTVTKEPVNLNELLDEIRASYDLATHKDIRLQWEYSSDLPIMATDSDKLKRILRNIIDNAVKFTQKGTITISVQHSCKPEIIEFKVADTGVGIPKIMLPVIFEMFRQADSSERREFEGVGLGLYIVKHFSELLGGEVGVESEEGKGSTFRVTIPTVVPADKRHRPAGVAELGYLN